MSLPFTDAEVQTIILANYATSALNLVGSSFTICTFLIFKDARNVATSLIFSLALSDFCFAVSTSFLWVFIGDPNTFECRLQGAIIMFGLVASMMWGLMIGMYMFLALYRGLELETVDKFRYLFHPLSWGYALTSAILPLVAPGDNDEYGVMWPRNKLSWCWLHKQHSVYRLMLYIPDTAVFGILILLYTLIRHRLRSAQSTLAQQICHKMSIYILVYGFINLFAIINRLQNFFAPDKAYFVLYLLQFSTQPLQGFLNAIAYVWNEPAFIDQYKVLFTKCTTRSLPIKTTSAEQQRLMSYVFYDNPEP